MDEFVLQSLIGTDKRSPLLSLCRVKGSNMLQIYYGAELLETIPSDPHHINYRAAIGRLYNAGLSRKRLQEVFVVDRKTMQRWGQALLMEDVEEAVRILSGERRHKVSLEIRRFIEVRYSFIYQRNRHSFNKEIREEVFATYGKRLSSETIRLIIKDYRARLASEGKEREDILELEDTSDDQECDEDDECGNDSSPSTPKLVSSEERAVLHIHHAGILIFSKWLCSITIAIGKGGEIIRQWLATILLEAVNIEQTKYLDFHSLSFLLGSTCRPVLAQRHQLDEISTDSMCTQVLRFNGEVVGINSCTDYYYDPHTKHYTGMHKILKGWCPCIRWADKALHSDIIHTSKGQPVYIKHFDNYYDLRERYQVVIDSFRRDLCIPDTKTITIVLDRGIFSIDVFETIKAKPNLELITWEKGFKDTHQWNAQRSDGSFFILRHHNSSRDMPRMYHFQYHDERWDKNSGIRRLIVHASNPQGKRITVSVLCTDMKRDADQIILLIFNRWIQENDFKYLDKHFGINQITSYDTINYHELRDGLKDKQIVNGTHKALVDERRKLEKKLKNALHTKHVLAKKLKGAEKELQIVEKQIVDVQLQVKDDAMTELGNLKRIRRSLKAKIGRWLNLDVDQKIKQLDEKCDHLTNMISQVEKDGSKLDNLINQQYKRLDIRKKNMMDVIKICARNIFHQALEPFKKQYDNYRDDHEYFRNLTHSDGIAFQRKKEMEVWLNPTAYLQPKTRTIMENILEHITQQREVFPDGSNKKLILKLMDKQGMKLAS